MGDVEPGSVIRFGTDDDITALVVGAYRKDIYVGDGAGGVKSKNVPALLMIGCYNEPGSWGEGRLFEQAFGELDTVAIVFEPGMF